MTKYITRDQMKERVLGFTSTIKGGKFENGAEKALGTLTRDGKLEGTGIGFKKRKVVGGIAVTSFKELERQGDKLVHPITGDVFEPTKKGTGYFCKALGVFFRGYMEGVSDDEEK